MSEHSVSQSASASAEDGLLCSCGTLGAASQTVPVPWLLAAPLHPLVVFTTIAMRGLPPFADAGFAGDWLQLPGAPAAALAGLAGLSVALPLRRSKVGSSKRSPEPRLREVAGLSASLGLLLHAWCASLTGSRSPSHSWLSTAHELYSASLPKSLP